MPGRAAGRTEILQLLYPNGDVMSDTQQADAIDQMRRIAELEAEVTTLKTQRDAFLKAARHAWTAFLILAGKSFEEFFDSPQEEK
jgi:hypothetical protein